VLCKHACRLCLAAGSLRGVPPSESVASYEPSEATILRDRETSAAPVGSLLAVDLDLEPLAVCPVPPTRGVLALQHPIVRSLSHFQRLAEPMAGFDDVAGAAAPVLRRCYKELMGHGATVVEKYVTLLGGGKHEAVPEPALTRYGFPWA
jgi:hypothetical protein